MIDHFQEWLNELEGWGFRSERLFFDCNDDPKLYERMQAWLKAAYEVGYDAAKKDFF